MEDEELQANYKRDLLPKTDNELPIPIGLRNCTKALFYEERHHTTSKITAPYCKKDYDYTYNGITYKSMYMIYMACDSEYEAAIVLLGSYAHWCKLKECTWFTPYFERWEAERNTRDEAVARKVLVTLAEAGNVTAAKSIYTNSKQPTSKVGRPEKGGARKSGVGDDVLDSMFKSSESAD